LDLKSTNKAGKVDMTEKTENIYLKARMAASKLYPSLRVRGVAAEELHVSIDSLFNYENGKTAPNEDMVFSMAELYGDQRLIVNYFLQTRTGRFLREQFGLDFEVGELTRATLGFVNCHRHVDLDRLISAVWDGEITPDELPDVQRVEALTRQSNQLLWALREAEKTPKKPKTALQSGNRKLKYAI
jgi:hypothetical protein